MDCRTTRLLFSDAQHGRLSADDLQGRQLHLRACESCSQAERGESALTKLLDDQLPRHRVPDAFKQRLRTQWLGGPGWAKRLPRLRSLLVPVGVAASLVLAIALGFSMGRRQGHGMTILGIEAVNDHLRMLEGETPLQVSTSDLHQVKPWFAGKLDFAPPLTFKGDDEYPMLGGQVTRFLERRVACFVFARRLHKISLFVLPKQGLANTGDGAAVDGRFTPTPKQGFSSRGFSVVSWEKGEFVYLLVSDVNTADLLELGNRIQSAR
jgi:anti-sigma factor RsiW